MNNTQIFLIRHGETDWNRIQRFQGQLDVPLNSQGQLQANAVAKRMVWYAQHQPFDALISSPLQRAAQTAQAIAQACDLPCVLDQAWQEQHFGVLQGLTPDQMQQTQSTAYDDWIQRNPSANFGTGESLQALLQRATTALNTLVQSYEGKRVIVVTHGGVLNAIYRCINNLSLTVERHWSIHNTSINQIQCFTTAGADSSQWSVLNWGMTDHLDHLDTHLDEKVA